MPNWHCWTPAWPTCCHSGKRTRSPGCAARPSTPALRSPTAAFGAAAPSNLLQAYATITLPGAAPVVIESVHPIPPIDAELTAMWEAGIRHQIRADAPGPRRILAGDFNATFDHHAFRELLDTGYRDAAAEVGKGLTATWPFYGRRSLVTPRITLDHVLVPAGVGVRDFRAVTIPRSDHRAILATLTI